MLVGDILEETRLLEGATEVGFAELCSGHGVAVELSLSSSSTDNVMKGAADVTVAGVFFDPPQLPRYPTSPISMQLRMERMNKKKA